MKLKKVKSLSKICQSTAVDKLYGTTTLGVRGQIVIPAAARKDLNLNPGDQVLVIGRLNRALGLMKTDQLEEVINIFMSQWAGTKMEKVVGNYVKKVFGQMAKPKNN